jgi:hypothetical protein
MFETTAQRMTPVWVMVLAARIGWHQYRKEQGHPISWRRALFGKFPRFSSFEEDEEGCPDWAKKYYDLVREKT